jgi:hypothetical protein
MYLDPMRAPSLEKINEQRRQADNLIGDRLAALRSSLSCWNHILMHTSPPTHIAIFVPPSSFCQDAFFLPSSSLRYSAERYVCSNIAISLSRVSLSFSFSELGCRLGRSCSFPKRS